MAEWMTTAVVPLAPGITVDQPSQTDIPIDPRPAVCLLEQVNPQGDTRVQLGFVAGDGRVDSVEDGYRISWTETWGPSRAC